RLPRYAVFGPLGLVLSCLCQLFQLRSESGQESTLEAREAAVEFFSVFQLRPAQRRRSASAAAWCGCSPGPFPFRLLFFPFRLPLSPFHPLLSLFEPMLPRVHRVPFCVEQAALRQPNLVFDRSR